MKKLVLGLCLVFGANVLNAEEYSCTYNFKKQLSLFDLLEQEVA